MFSSMDLQVSSPLELAKQVEVGTPRLTRADVRAEVEAALEIFTEQGLLCELKQFVRQELRVALEELWAGAGRLAQPPHFSHAAEEIGGNKDVPHVFDLQGVRGASPASTLVDSCAPDSLGATTPSTSPVSTASSDPVGLEAVLTSTPSRKDWRRSFVEKAMKANRKVECLHGHLCPETLEVSEAIEEAGKALDDGVQPDLVEDGLGGTYFIKDRRGRSIAVFKPRDEEPLAPNNPKVHVGGGQASGLKEGVLVGEAALHEYAAFLLDQASGPALRAGVSPTALVRVADSAFHAAEEDRRSTFRKVKDKVGSFQLFAQHDGTSEDVSPSRFPAEQVHRIAVLDIRLCNTDRHSGNILIRGECGAVNNLVPIDHGYALPSEVGEASFEWLSWPAARLPFSEQMRNDILAIDIDAMEAMLKKRIPFLREECVATLRVCTLFLQRGVSAGLTAYDIGALMVRPESLDPEPSTLEVLLASAWRFEAEKASMPGRYELMLEALFDAKFAEVARASDRPEIGSAGVSASAGDMLMR